MRPIFGIFILPVLLGCASTPQSIVGGTTAHRVSTAPVATPAAVQVTQNSRSNPQFLVAVRKSGPEFYEKRPPGTPTNELPPKSEIRTGQATVADIAFADGSRLSMRETSGFSVVNYDRGRASLNLRHGEFYIDTVGERLVTAIPNIVMLPGSTFAVRTEGESSRVYLFDGKIEFSQPSRAVLRPNQYAVIEGGAVSIFAMSPQLSLEVRDRFNMTDANLQRVDLTQTRTTMLDTPVQPTTAALAFTAALAILVANEPDAVSTTCEDC